MQIVSQQVNRMHRSSVKVCGVAAAAIVLASMLVASQATAGPVKHWAIFPGRTVRAIALRGDQLSSEPRFFVAEARDKNIYIRGVFGLYRLLDDQGHYARVAYTGDCAGYSEAHGADLRGSLPRAICSRAADIILVGGQRNVHIRTPAAFWPPSLDRYSRGDRRFLTAVTPAIGGGYWFGYATPGAIGRVRSTGRSESRHFVGVGSIKAMAALGHDVYVVDDDCNFGRIRSWRLIETWQNECRRSWPNNAFNVTRDGAVWMTGGSSLERRDQSGGRRRWQLAMSATGVAVTRDGTAYVLGYRASGAKVPHPALGVISRGVPTVRTLPMTDVGSIYVDDRDRIWITDPYDHAVALISPQTPTTAMNAGKP